MSDADARRMSPIPRFTILWVTSRLAFANAAAFLIIAAYTLFVARYSASAYVATSIASLALGWVLDLDWRIRKWLAIQTALTQRLGMPDLAATERDIAAKLRRTT